MEEDKNQEPQATLIQNYIIWMILWVVVSLHQIMISTEWEHCVKRYIYLSIYLTVLVHYIRLKFTRWILLISSLLTSPETVRFNGISLGNRIIWISLLSLPVLLKFKTLHEQNTTPTLYFYCISSQWYALPDRPILNVTPTTLHNWNFYFNARNKMPSYQ